MTCTNLSTPFGAAADGCSLASSRVDGSIKLRSIMVQHVKYCMLSWRLLFFQLVVATLASCILLCWAIFTDQPAIWPSLRALHGHLHVHHWRVAVETTKEEKTFPRGGVSEFLEEEVCRPLPNTESVALLRIEIILVLLARNAACPKACTPK